MKQRSDLKKTRNNLSGVATNINDSSFMPYNIPDVEIPCMEDPTQTCLLINNGESITSLDGGPPIPVSELSANLPMDIKTAQAEALQQALNESQDLQNIIARARAANPANDIDSSTSVNLDEDGNDPNTGNSASNGATGTGNSASNDPNTGNSASNAITGNNNSPAFNFDPLGLNEGSSTGAVGFASNSGFHDAGGNTPELSAPPVGVYDDDQGGSYFSGSGAFAGNSGLYSNEEDSANNYAAQSTGPGSRFASWSTRGPNSAGSGQNNVRSIPFGRDKVADASTNIFSTIRDRYQSYTDSGQFIPPSTQGPVVIPTIPTGTE